MKDKKKRYAQLRRQLGWMKKTIIFAHMPKAAGISLNTTMKQQYGRRRVLELDPTQPIPSLEKFREETLWQLFQYRVISGHVLWGIHEWLPKPFIYITVLRHPVSRVLSLYSYILSSKTHRLHQEMTDANMSLEEFLVWKKSALEVNNNQTKLLATPTLYGKECDQHLFKLALNNLQTYCMVGLTERFDESLKMFADLFQWENMTIAHDNVTPNRIKEADISPTTRRKIEESNQFDMRLYEAAQELFERQKKDIQVVFAEKTTC